jgi:hypothetical protein
LDEDEEEDESEDEDLTEAEADTEFGRVCAVCGEKFNGEHGVPTICADCNKAHPNVAAEKGYTQQTIPLERDA